MRTALRKGGWTLRTPVGSCGPSLCASRVSANYILCARSRSQSGLGGHCGSARAFHAATVLEAAEPKAKKTKQQKKQESEERKKEKEKQKEKKKKELLAEQKLQQESANFEVSNENVLEDLNDPTRGPLVSANENVKEGDFKDIDGVQHVVLRLPTTGELCWYRTLRDGVTPEMAFGKKVGNKRGLWTYRGERRPYYRLSPKSPLWSQFVLTPEEMIKSADRIRMEFNKANYRRTQKRPKDWSF
ncbi:hypothetical protein QOT17_020097 [Balamuthia mandrillaris]